MTKQSKGVATKIVIKTKTTSKTVRLERSVRHPRSSWIWISELWSLNPYASLLLPDSLSLQLNTRSGSTIHHLHGEIQVLHYTYIRWWSHPLRAITSIASCRTSPAWRFSSSILKRYLHFVSTISHNVGKSDQNIHQSFFSSSFGLKVTCIVHRWIDFSYLFIIFPIFTLNFGWLSATHGSSNYPFAIFRGPWEQIVCLKALRSDGETPHYMNMYFSLRETKLWSSLPLTIITVWLIIMILVSFDIMLVSYNVDMFV